MLTMTSDQLLAMSNDTFMKDTDSLYEVKVVCHDGEKVTTNRHIQYLHGFLHFNRAHNAPVSISQVFSPDFIPTPKLHTKNMELAVSITAEHTKGAVLKHEIAPMWIDCVDSHTNACIADLEHFSCSIDEEDLMDFVLDETIAAMRVKMKDTLAGKEGPEIKSNAIIDCNASILCYIKDNGPTLWPNNGVVHHILAGSIKTDQLMQIINVIGYMTEIDSEIYPMAIAESIAEGLNYPYTYAINTSLGKKATIYNKGPISETETLSRLVQQMASQVENVHLTDCGSIKTSPMLVSKSNGPALVGMYHLVKGKPKLITKGEIKKLIGRMIDLRTVAGCDHPDPVGICSTCGGASLTNFVLHYNVGGASSCLLLGRNSQRVLKTKHVDIINFNNDEVLSECFRDFLSLSDNGKEIFLNDNCKKATISFLATKRREKDKTTNGQFLHTALTVKSLDDAEIESFGEVERLILNPNNGLDDELEEAQLKHGSIANFSPDLLRYIRNNPTKLTMERHARDKTGYLIDLDGFDITLPIFSMPFRNQDSLSLHNSLSQWFLSPNDKLPGEVLSDYTSFGAALQRLSKMTYGSLGVNMGILQLLLIPFTIRDRSKGDWKMTNNGDAVEFGKMSDVRKRRSLSVVTIANNQGDSYGHLSAFVRDDLSPHSYDQNFV